MPARSGASGQTPAAPRRPAGGARRPSEAQRRWLARGAAQAGGKLPLFEPDGREVPRALIRACLDAGWAEPWFANPAKPDWLVCRLTAAGRAVVDPAAFHPKSTSS